MKLPRNLYNGDWGTLFWAPGLWQPEGGTYSVKALHRFVDNLAESGVEAFLISPNTQVAWYPSKVMPKAWDGYTRDDPRWAHWLPVHAPEVNLAMINRYLDFVEAGVDWLEVVIGRCRKRGIIPWVSIRMNDMHGIEDPAGNPINCKLFADPKYRLAGRRINPANPPRDYWQAMSYECPEVRDHYFRMIRELVEDYDFAGLELDFLRNPAIGEPDSPPEFCEVMANWLDEIRSLTRRRGGGDPYPVGLRIPGQLALLKSIGLDVKMAVERELIDFVGFSNFMQTSWTMPHDDLRRELGGDLVHYGVTELVLSGVQGLASDTGERTGRFTCASAEALRGNAAGKLVLGVDGIEQFNVYAADADKTHVGQADSRSAMRADYAAIKGVHDLESLRGKPKQYAFSCLISSCWYPPFDLPEPFPEVFWPDWRRTYRLPMCAEPNDAGLELIFQIVTEKQENPPAMGISFNGSWPTFAGEPTDELLFPNRPATHHLPEHTAWNYHFDPVTIREGWNEIVICHGDIRSEGPGRPVTVVSLEVGLREAG